MGPEHYAKRPERKKKLTIWLHFISKNIVCYKINVLIFSFQYIVIGIVYISDHFPAIGNGIGPFYL